MRQLVARASIVCVVMVIHAALVPARAADTTRTIQKSIDRAFMVGGGRVVVPAGTHEVTSLRLRSGVELYLESGAVLQASRNPQDYDDLIVRDGIEPFEAPRCEILDKLAASSTSHWNNAIIQIYGARDVMITGEPGSAIDGRNCYDPKGEEKFRGPHGIAVHFSTNVVFSGYELRNAGNWSHRVCLSADVAVRNVKVRGGHDGLDFHACDRVTVTDCDLQAGDDCVAGYDIRNLTVRNCRLNTACSCFRLGGRDILVEDVVAEAPAVFCHRRSLQKEDLIDGTNPPDRGRRTTLSFFTYYGAQRARGRSENIVFRRCRVSGVERLMHYNFSGNEWWQSGQPLADVTFEDVNVTGLAYPLHAYAPADTPLLLSFLRCRVHFAGKQAEFMKGANVGKISIDDLHVKGVGGAFMRSWLGIPDFDVTNLKGVEPTVVFAVEPFIVKPI